MAYVLPVGLGVVAAVFLLIVVGEVFYLFYWRKRPLAYPRGNNVTVAPVNEAEGTREGSEVVIDVTCAEYQIAALHQDLVEKLFPALGVSSSSSTESTHNLMGPTRMLFTITEETKEELEGLDLCPRRRSRRSSRSKSMSDISLSPMGPLSPLSSSPFATPLSSPDQDQFITPYGTPTYSPLVTLPRSVSASPVLLHTSCRIMHDYSSCSPPQGPPSPTRPTFPFLSRESSPSKSSDGVQETSEWGSSNGTILSPNNALFYSPPREPFVFATPSIHSKQMDIGSLTKSPLRACTYVYENGTFSPSPSSPQFFPSLLLTHTDHPCHDIQDHSSSSSPPSSSPSASLSPFFHQCTPPSDTVVTSSIPVSSSCRPSSQRSSSALFSNSLPRPSLSSSLAEDAPPKYFLDTGPSPPSGNTTTISSSWGE